MDCKTVRTHTFAFIDDELDVATALELQSHLDQCAECASRAEFELQCRRQLRERAVRFALPAVAERKIWREIDRLDQEERGARRIRALSPRLQWAAGFALTAVLVLAIVALVPLRRSDTPLWLSSSVDGHIRTLQATHPLEVESGDRHMVKPWFSGKIDFAFSLPDVEGADVTLLGGRLEYLADQRVAHLLYQVRQHRISVFILRHPQGEAGLSAMMSGQQKGFQYVVVQRPMLTYTLISDVNPQDLMALARHFAEIVP